MTSSSVPFAWGSPRDYQQMHGVGFFFLSWSLLGAWCCLSQVGSTHHFGKVEFLVAGAEGADAPPRPSPDGEKGEGSRGTVGLSVMYCMSALWLLVRLIVSVREHSRLTAEEKGGEAWIGWMARKRERIRDEEERKREEAVLSLYVVSKVP